MDSRTIFIGMNRKQAEIMAARLGYTVRIVCVDGEGCVGTADLDNERINVVLENDIVTNVYMG